MTKIILASTSKYRKQLLQQLKIDFETLSPTNDEDLQKEIFLKTNMELTDRPQKLAEHLAIEKAKSVAQKNSIVIGSDQLLQFQNKIYGKAKTIELAKQHLLELSSHQAQLITAVTVIHNLSSVVSFTNITNLTFRKLNKQEIERYIAKDQPLDCAGSFKIESLGISLFSKIETDDFSAIQGLPLIQLAQVLRDFSIEIP
jgi:septum formation protein